MNLKYRRTAQVVTAVSLQGGWVKLLQAQPAAEGPPKLLGIKARKVSGLTEEAMAGALKELVQTLPMPPREVVGLLSAGGILTRYLNLPSENPEELRAMALYQLEGVLPFSLQECVTAVKIVGKVGEATRVLVAVAHRPVVERLIRICKQAGLSLSEVTTSSEAIGQWHRLCWPGGAESVPKVWLVAELTSEGIDIGVLVGGSLIYMRQISQVAASFEELVAQFQETMEAYTKEQIGPPVELVTLSGWHAGLKPILGFEPLLGFESMPLERLEEALGVSVRQVDPLEQSPFRETLSVTVQEFASEVSFSELLGAACAPRLMGLDLLPLETHWQRARVSFLAELRWVILLGGLGAALGLGWVGTRIGGTAWRLNQTRQQQNLLEPQVARVRGMADTIRATQRARQEYASQMEWLIASARGLSGGMSLQFLGLQAQDALTLRGTAPGLEAVTAYATGLRKESFWKSVQLRSAKVQQQTGASSKVEFEILLEPKGAGREGHEE